MTNQKLLAVSIEFVTCSFIFTLAFSYMYLLVLNFFLVLSVSIVQIIAGLIVVSVCL
jgi:hypothetical protein